VVLEPFREGISGMRKLRIIIPIVMAIVAVTTISLSVALAQENERDDSNASRLAAKVSEILGLDEAEVDDAIKQARREIRYEAIQKKLNTAVENGNLTQEQADEHLNRLQSKPDGIPAIGKPFFGKMRMNKDWKGHGRFFGSGNYFNVGTSSEAIQKKLNTAVENGNLTQEQADAKLTAVQAKEAEKTAYP
jgi:polyhydroxyalkanoate synthesis regulator phasin